MDLDLELESTVSEFLKSGVVVEQLSSDRMWVERWLMFDEKSGKLKISTQKLLAPETEISLASIASVQVEPSKTLHDSRASLYISAGKESVQIRLPDEGAAKSLATELRELTPSQIGRVQSVAFDPDGKILLVAGQATQGPSDDNERKDLRQKLLYFEVPEPITNEAL